MSTWMSTWGGRTLLNMHMSLKSLSVVMGKHQPGASRRQSKQENMSSQNKNVKVNPLTFPLSSDMPIIGLGASGKSFSAFFVLPSWFRSSVALLLELSFLFVASPFSFKPPAVPLVVGSVVSLRLLRSTLWPSPFELVHAYRVPEEKAVASGDWRWANRNVCSKPDLLIITPVTEKDLKFCIRRRWMNSGHSCLEGGACWCDFWLMPCSREWRKPVFPTLFRLGRTSRGRFLFWGLRRFQLSSASIWTKPCLPATSKPAVSWCPWVKRKRVAAHHGTLSNTQRVAFYFNRRWFPIIPIFICVRSVAFFVILMTMFLWYWAELCLTLGHAIGLLFA